MFSTIPLSSIKISSRIRKDLGDIKALAASIKELGLLSPLVINEDNNLLAGERRYEAIKLLGWSEVPVNVISTSDAENMLSIEISENQERKNFSREELVNAGIELERIEKVKAEERMKAGVVNPRENFPQGNNGKSRDIVASHLGISGKQYEREKYIVENKDILSPGEYSDWNNRILSTNKIYTKIKNLLDPKAPKEVTKEVITEKEVFPEDYEALKDKAQLVSDLEKSYETTKAELEKYKSESSESLSASLSQAEEELVTLRYENEQLRSDKESAEKELFRLQEKQFGPIGKAVNIAGEFERELNLFMDKYSRLLYQDFFKNNSDNSLAECVLKAAGDGIDFLTEVIKKCENPDIIDFCA